METENPSLQNDFKTLNLPNGEVIAYREAGDSSKVLVFLHCFGGSSILFRSYFPKFSDQFRVIAFDLRGHGNSSFNTKISKIEDLVEDVKQSVDLLGLKKFSILGWSAGGGTALKFAADYPEYVENVILLSSIGAQGSSTFKVDENGVQAKERAQTEEEIFKTPFVQFMLGIVNQQDKMKAKGVLNNAFYSGKGGHDSEIVKLNEETFLLCKCIGYLDNAINKFNISHENNGVTDGTGEIKNVQAPVLILHGKNDIIVSYSEAEKLKALLQEKAELKLFDDAGHGLINDYPEEVVNSIRDFISK